MKTQNNNSKTKQPLPKAFKRLPVQTIPLFTPIEYGVIDYIYWRHSLEKWQIKLSDLQKQTNVKRKAQLLIILNDWVSRGWINKQPIGKSGKHHAYIFRREKFDEWLRKSYDLLIKGQYKRPEKSKPIYNSKTDFNKVFGPSSQVLHANLSQVPHANLTGSACEPEKVLHANSTTKKEETIKETKKEQGAPSSESFDSLFADIEAKAGSYNKSRPSSEGQVPSSSAPEPNQLTSTDQAQNQTASSNLSTAKADEHLPQPGRSRPTVNPADIDLSEWDELSTADKVAYWDYRKNGATNKTPGYHKLIANIQRDIDAAQPQRIN